MIKPFPRTFYDDHRDRDLPTPIAHRETDSHVWLDQADISFGELVNDAEYYASADGPDGAPQVTKAAKSFLKALG